MSVEDDLEPRKAVYFTNQDVEFVITIENMSGHALEVEFELGLFFPEIQSDYYVSEHYDLKLEVGEQTERTFSVGLLPYQSTGVLGLISNLPSASTSPKESGYTIEPVSGTPNLKWALHTFVVYDREYYRANYYWPRIAQYVSAFLAVLIIAVGVLQLLSV
jgi:hypothetical protein